MTHREADSRRERQSSAWLPEPRATPTTPEDWWRLPPEATFSYSPRLPVPSQLSPPSGGERPARGLHSRDVICQPRTLATSGAGCDRDDRMSTPLRAEL